MFLKTSRGSALVETVLFLPVFLVALFGVIWAVRVGVLNERVQLAVRYSGLVSQEISPYEQYSLWAVYTGASGAAVPAPACSAPPAGILDDTAPEQATPSRPFWAPDTVGTLNCTAQRTGVTGAGLSAPQLFTTAHASASATDTVPSYLVALLGTVNTLSAQQTFVNAPDVASVMTCYPALASAVGPSFAGPRDTATAAQPSAPLGDPPQAAPSSLDTGCLTAPLGAGKKKGG